MYEELNFNSSQSVIVLKFKKNTSYRFSSVARSFREFVNRSF
jgi:hypothetical protein